MLQEGFAAASDYRPTVQYTVGVEAAGDFKHVSGSACCVMPPFEVDGPETCRQTCLSIANCGSFLFAPATSDCYHAPHEADLSPVDGPDACERRCRGKADCDAFVFAPSTHLCFLVRFTQDSVGMAWNVSVRPAEDRVFGLVRDRQGLDPHGSSRDAQALHSWTAYGLHRSARETQALHSWTAHGLAIVGFAAVGWAARSKLRMWQGTFFLASMAGWVAAVVNEAIPIIGARLLRLLTTRAEVVASVVRWPHRRTVAMTDRSDESVVTDLERETHDEPAQQPWVDHRKQTQHSQEMPRLRIPAKREVDWAGPTNYPVMGHVSPNVRGCPREPLFTVSADPLSDPSNGYDCGPKLGRIPWVSSFGVHHGLGSLLIVGLGVACFAMLFLGATSFEGR